MLNSLFCCLSAPPLLLHRYYGQKKTGEEAGSQAMFVEQKTHRDKASGQSSTKVCVGGWCF